MGATLGFRERWQAHVCIGVHRREERRRSWAHARRKGSRLGGEQAIGGQVGGDEQMER